MIYNFIISSNSELVMQSRHLVTKVLSPGAKQFHSSKPALDARTYINHFPQNFMSEHGMLISQHSDFFSKMDDVNKRYLSMGRNNTEIRALYAGTKGLEDNIGCSDKLKLLGDYHKKYKQEQKEIIAQYKVEMIETGLSVCTSVVDFLAREIVKYGARGQMIKNEDLETLERIHEDATQKYGNPIGPTLSSLKESGKDIEASSQRKRDPMKLKEDLEQLKSKQSSSEVLKESPAPGDVPKAGI